jgi:hypothetical protein
MSQWNQLQYHLIQTADIEHYPDYSEGLGIPVYSRDIGLLWRHTFCLYIRWDKVNHNFFQRNLSEDNLLNEKFSK